MEDTADNKTEKICKIAEAIDDMNGENTIALDVTNQSSWTDYFIISTVSSYAHLKGIYRKLQELLETYDIDSVFKHKKINENSWVLIDCGFFVIHLMEKDARAFYELEKLWFNSKTIYQSSKSS